ncbi:biotin--[acetyl-CoA-carboxylase] ligase [Lentisalinibacter orientalis]|uniref:biotin--[acetyl-CoA-carboxylase] ligase n=1 Tax=Lentisalinibacter orientalis TaxID=2992241 RepID=UPI003862E9D6
MTTPDPLNEEGIRDALPDGSGAWLEHLDVFDTIDSTNDWLAGQMPPAEGRLAAAVADYQSKGRGRRGRQWDIPPGHGLCLSVARAVTVPAEAVSALTLACGTAAAETLESFGAEDIRLKWPNDLVLIDGKLGGILSEIAGRAGAATHVVVGIGINVSLPAGFAPPGDIGWGRGPAALAEVLEPLPARNRLAAALIDALQTAFDAYEAGGFAPFAERWQRRDWMRGSEVTVRDADGEARGVAAGIDAGGALLVDTPDGQRRIIAGDILRCRRPAPGTGN